MNKSIFLIGFLGILLAGCKPKKLIPTGPVPDRSKSELYRALSERNMDFDWFAGKAKVKIQSPQENAGGKAYIRMKKDSVIWIVMKKIGAEVARTLITKDSFFVIYRVERKFSRGSLADLQYSYDLNFGFEDLQQMVFGNVIIPDSTNMIVEKENYHYKVQSTDGDIKMEYLINAYDLSLSEFRVTDRNDRFAKVLFDNYNITENSNTRISYLRECFLPVDTIGEAKLKLEYSEFKIDEAKSMPFKIPGHYEEVR